VSTPRWTRRKPSFVRMAARLVLLTIGLCLVTGISLVGYGSANLTSSWGGDTEPVWWIFIGVGLASLILVIYVKTGSNGKRN